VSFSANIAEKDTGNALGWPLRADEDKVPRRKGNAHMTTMEPAPRQVVVKVSPEGDRLITSGAHYSGHHRKQQCRVARFHLTRLYGYPMKSQTGCLNGLNGLCAVWTTRLRHSLGRVSPGETGHASRETGHASIAGSACSSRAASRSQPTSVDWPSDGVTTIHRRSAGHQAAGYTL
jgi:hypothetical protein